MIRRIPLLLTLVSCGALLNAEVADSSSSGFTVKLAATVQASPAEAYRRFVLNIGEWWSSEHSWSGDAHNITIDAKPMGCWCEKLPNGGGVKHMEVVTAMPGKMLVMRGELGPLQTMATAGAMTVQFSAVEGGTKIALSYAVAGYVAGGMDKIAPMVDKVLAEQVGRFKGFVEGGAAGK